MRPAPVLALPLAAALLLAACGGGAPVPPATSGSPSGAPSGAPATTAALTGHTFLSQAASGVDLVEGSQVRLTFEATRIGASAGCNQLGGEYEVAAGALKIGPMMTTEMACEQPLMAQDAWLSAFLPGATATLDGDTLTLAKDGVTLTLLDESVATPTRPLAGTRWILDGIVSGGAVSSVPAGSRAAIQLDGGMLAVDTGCNRGSGTVQASDGVLSFGPIALTKMACTADAGAAEGPMTTVLQGEAGYTIDGDTLTIVNGAAGLVFKAEG